MAIRWFLDGFVQATWISVIAVITVCCGVYMFYQASTHEVFSRRVKEESIQSESDQELVTSEDDVAPVILVHGVFGFGEGRMGGIPYFGGIENRHRLVFNPDLGSLTSLYDRARRLFYYIKGGQVDYGEEHSKIYGHSQFGFVYKQGRYPEWNEDNPIHFVGHSAGAQVVRILQQMLANKAFKGYDNTNAKWIASITSLAGVLNGSTIPYMYGIKPNKWRYAETISSLGLLTFAILIYDWLDIPLLKRYYNFGFDHFHMSRKEIGFWGLVDCILGNAGPFASSDWVIPDVTIQGTTQINSQIQTFPDTYYFSYASKATKQVKGKVVPKRLRRGDAWLRIQTSWMTKWRYPTHIQLPYNDYRDEDWLDNDSQLNTISMTHPRLPSEHSHCFVANGYNQIEAYKPGIWYYEMLEAYHDQFVLSIKTGSHIHKLYDTIFNRCRNLKGRSS